MRYALAILTLISTGAQAAQPFEGAWASRPADCAEPADGNIMITGTKYFEHEGICKINSAKGFQGTWSLFLSCEGEGEKWNKVVTVAPTGNKMKMGGDGERSLVRCGKEDRPPNWPQR